LAQFLRFPQAITLQIIKKLNQAQNIFPLCFVFSKVNIFNPQVGSSTKGKLKRLLK
jgi:hypothetical protein